MQQRPPRQRLSSNADCDGDPQPKIGHEIPDAKPTYGYQFAVNKFIGDPAFIEI